MGITVGKYRLLRRIAIGGMAEIYLAVVHGEAGFERKVIIKKILPHHADEPEFVRRLIDEGLLAARLSHSNIVQVLDLGRLGPDYFIAMEFVDGVDLRNVLTVAADRSFRIPPPIGIHILWEVARALGYAHHKKSAKGEPLSIIHRDISPANIFISWEGAVKLGDFGIAKASQRLSRHTMTGILQGKFPYMSPEQGEGDPLSQASDIFSFGSVAYELMTGERPFPGDSDMQILARVREAVHRPPVELRGDLPPEFVAVIEHCLQREMAHRYATGAELEQALGGVMKGKGWVVGAADVADFLSILYGDAKRSLAEEVDAMPAQAGEVVEASPLDPFDMRAGMPTPAGRTPQPMPPVEQTRAVASPTWQKRKQRRGMAWALWSGIMAAFAIFMLLDYFALHLFLGSAPPTDTSSAAIEPETGQAEAMGRDAAADGPAGLDALAAVEHRQATDVVAETRSAHKPGVAPPTPDIADAGGSSRLDATDDGVDSREQRETENARDTKGADTVSMPADAGGETTVPAPPVEKKRSFCRITVIPGESAVLANGRLLGAQPQRVEVTEGDRPVNIRLEADGYEPAEFELSYPPPYKIAKRLNRKSMGSIRLRYFPASARLFIDGEEVKGKGGLNIVERKLAAGQHVVVVRHDGRETSKTITIRGDKEWTGTIKVDP